MAPASRKARTRSATGGDAEGGGPAQVTSTPPGPAVRSATSAGSASHTVRAAPAARASCVRAGRPPRHPDPEPRRGQPAPQLDHVGPALGRRREGDAVSAVLLLAQRVARTEPGDHPARGQSVERPELRGEHLVGDQPDPGHERTEVGPLSRTAGRAEHRRQGTENGEGRQGRPLGLAEGPDVVVTEDAVHPGADRCRSGGERLVRLVTERRQHDARPHQPKPPSRTASAPPTAPGPLPEGGGDDQDAGAPVTALDEFGEGGAGGLNQEVTGLDHPPAQHEAPGVEHGGQVGQSEADPPPDLADHLLRRRVARRGRGGDVLAPHALGVATGEPDDLAQPSRQGGLPGQHPEPGAGGEALPAAAPPAGARGPVGVHHHVADLAGEAGGRRPARARRS